MFYNGTEDAPEREDIKLSDAFEVPSDGYEWTAVRPAAPDTPEKLSGTS